jgi:hypothetical protein
MPFPLVNRRATTSLLHYTTIVMRAVRLLQQACHHGVLYMRNTRVALTYRFNLPPPKPPSPPGAKWRACRRASATLRGVHWGLRRSSPLRMYLHGDLKDFGAFIKSASCLCIHAASITGATLITKAFFRMQLKCVVDFLTTVRESQRRHIVHMRWLGLAGAGCFGCAAVASKCNTDATQASMAAAAGYGVT